MRQLLLTGLLTLTLLPPPGWATDDTYVNNGTITFPPQIDATNVINNGTFSLSTTLPFDTSNTRNFTNTGSMIGSVGFQFDNAPSTGPRRMAANFHNRQSGTITAVDGYFESLFDDNGRPIVTDHDIPAYLLISATNVINEGLLSVGPFGLMEMVGTNVNLARSGVQIEAITPRLRGSFTVNTNWFEPDAAIYDNYWGQTNQIINSAEIIQTDGGGVTVGSPWSNVQFEGGASGSARVEVSDPVSDFYEDIVAYTNVIITGRSGGTNEVEVPSVKLAQAVFVGLDPASELSVGIRFADSSVPDNPFKTASVSLTTLSTNPVTVSPELASIYLVDELASGINRGILTNAFTDTTARPANYILQRSMPAAYAGGFPGNGNFRNDFLYESDFASAVVTNDYAAYSATVENVLGRVPVVPNAEVSQLPGRISIQAHALDMNRARFRAEGLAKIEARHLKNSTNAVVDCEHLSFTLGATNGQLNIVNLARDRVARLKGEIDVWSGVWTNFQNMVLTNYAPDPSDPDKFIRADITNVVQVLLYAMILDASQLLTSLPVKVYDFVTHSTNVVVNDNLTIIQSLLIDGLSFTLNGGITLSNTYFTSPSGNIVVIELRDWVATNAPNLLYFTNHGTLNVPSEAHFGDDRPVPYSAFVNTGEINAGGQNIASSFFENTGFLNAGYGGVRVTTASGKLEGGRINSTTDVEFFADVLKFNQATIQTGSRLDLTVTNSLFDAGGGSGNSFVCRDGFRLLTKPPTGDLLGTTMESVAPAFAQVDHNWAGEDRGASSAGYANNTALGRLVLTPGDYEEWFPPLFFFAGTGGGNALYVDFLDLSRLLDYQIELEINPDLVIYYAAAALSFTPPATNGVPQQAEEYLDGQFEGRLRWVRDFAGPNSSVDVLVNGKTEKKNRALRNSRILDDDGDGIPNYYDAEPFGGLGLTAILVQTNQPSAARLAISWTAAAETGYQVEYTSDLDAGNWQPLVRYTNSAPNSAPVTIWDTNAPVGAARRFYRVGALP